ncbi:hypothetical protein BC628DRAFT_294126 [Trametes gibbosa]|nr:hypothetical protein BC628DRAFT_294126 [Trametes gibbosa]
MSPRMDAASRRAPVACSQLALHSRPSHPSASGRPRSATRRTGRSHSRISNPPSALASGRLIRPLRCSSRTRAERLERSSVHARPPPPRARAHGDHRAVSRRGTPPVCPPPAFRLRAFLFAHALASARGKFARNAHAQRVAVSAIDSNLQPLPSFPATAAARLRDAHARTHATCSWPQQRSCCLSARRWSLNPVARPGMRWRVPAAMNGCRQGANPAGPHPQAPRARARLHTPRAA